MRVEVLVNAGAVAKDEAFGAERLRQALAVGGEALVRVLPGSELGAAARAAAEKALDAVVAAGGDGTVSAVAGALAGTEKPLGILPLGTLNHFAKDLGIPTDLEGAVRTLRDGIVRKVDVGEVNGRIFVNNSSIGFYPIAVRERIAKTPLLGKWGAMTLAIFRLLWRFPRMRLRLIFPEGERPRRTPLVFVGNNRYDMKLLGSQRRAALNRGELCLYLPPPASRRRLFLIALGGLLGTLDAERDLESICTASLRVDSHRRRLLVANDGEVLHLYPPLLYRSRPGVLRVIAPPVSP